MRKYGFVIAILLHISIFAEEFFLAPLDFFLQPIENVEKDSGLEGIDCIYVINLKERPERWTLVEEQFLEQNLRASRVDAINGWKIPVDQRNVLIDPRVFHSRSLVLNGGEIGCFLSHLSIYQDALERGFNVIWSSEDDIRFNKKVDVISSLVEQLTWLDPEWDLLYTDYTMFGSGTQWHRPEQGAYTVINQQVSSFLARTHGRFGMQSVIFSRNGLEKIMAYYSSRYFWAPIDVDIHYIGLREYSITQNLTSIRSGSSSDTQSTSTLRNRN